MKGKFPRVKFLKKGYDTAAVDEFFEFAEQAYTGGLPASEFSAEQVRRAMFPLVRGGYDPYTVDAALDRMEGGFIQRDRANHVAVNGEAAWLAHVADRATTLYPRLSRPEGERFAHPEKDQPGYSAEAVDAFLARLADFFDQNEPLTVREIRSLTFPPAKEQKAYVEGAVDAYLARVIEILLSVES
ncbi:DivIVA domain repeat protein [Gleimia coleocanis DSM 15436]|uniref:DivIVA domain repeat protein n=1 Tax=Gleimia coleocanis DSM 15436 TaxID=525245 RepID=C0W051_9ACTO|nr:DivIVA domain-containing protein [Gleimia coleocanis]EEH63910.1 DivIVA domain repeat protein [Gleimia coleocanis DSM 15436]